MPDIVNDLVIQFQGSRWVPPQAYVDLYASRHFPLGGAGSPYELSLDLGIVNLLDTSPPRETFAGTGAGISPYGDPRRRRVELAVSVSF